MTLRTDGKWHDFKYRNEVPKTVLRREFDWLDSEGSEDHFIRYQRGWMHLSQFERTNEPDWDGVMPTSMTTAILIKVSRDGEQYKIASARW